MRINLTSSNGQSGINFNFSLFLMQGPPGAHVSPVLMLYSFIHVLTYLNRVPKGQRDILDLSHKYVPL